MDFVSIDVETANSDMASICQIGIAMYIGDSLIDQWVSLIDPEDYFDPINIDIHGIDPMIVDGAPTFPEIVAKVRQFLSDTVVVSHTHFDRISLERVFAKYDLTPIDTCWLDSAMVARRAWPEFAWRGYGLKNVCNKIGHTFKHHDALEDAKAAAAILLAAIKETDLDLSTWQKRVKQPIDPNNSSLGSAVNRSGNPEGELFGEVVVFTGTLEIPRKEAADLAAKIGCDVSSGVTRKTTLLIVGDQDISRLAGKEKSSKHIKAERLITSGQKIRIIKESDFKELVTHSSVSNNQD
ncbi:MAG: exonuclease domain-containing protein [Neptuniibacter sp.]